MYHFIKKLFKVFQLYINDTACCHWQEFVLHHYLLVVKNNSFGQSFECDYTRSDVPSHSKMIDWLSSVLCRVQNFFTLLRRQHWRGTVATSLCTEGIYTVPHRVEAAKTWPVLRFPSGSYEKLGKRQLFWTRQDYITLHLSRSALIGLNAAAPQRQMVTYPWVKESRIRR